MEKYAKYITVIDNSHKYSHYDKILEILEDIKNKKNKKIKCYEWFGNMTISQLEELAIDLINIQLLDHFEKVTHCIYRKLPLF